jgi:lysophospholipase L1-like esterase
MMRFNRFLLIFSVGTILASASAAQEKRITIFAVGDSITWGQAFGSGHDYPRVLQQMLAERGLTQVRVTNYGVSGYTVGDSLKTWKSSQRILTRIDVQYVLIMLGTNDTRVGDETPLDVYVQRMNELIDIFVSVTNSDGSHPQVILSLIPPHNSPKEGEYMTDNFKDRFIHRDRIPNELNPALQEIARQRGLMVVDNYSPLKAAGPEILPDGLHPAKEGNAILAKTFFEALLPVLEAQAGISPLGFQAFR